MVSDSDNAAVATVRDQGPASKRYDETFPVIAGSGSRTVSRRQALTRWLVGIYFFNRTD